MDSSQKHIIGQKSLALIVDDLAVNRQILEKYLSLEGYQTISAKDGQQAVQIYIERHPDIVFMDVMMPVMDGYQATMQIKTLAGARFVPVIFLFDFHVQRDFKEAYDPQLSNPAVGTIEVNLASVDYLDSSALGMLLMLRERATAAGKKLKLCKPGASVAQILEIANFAKLFTIEK